MFALTFFGVLHVPINVPALGISTGEDNLNVDRELMAHGVTNALSGFAGSIQVNLLESNENNIALTIAELSCIYEQSPVHSKRRQFAVGGSHASCGDGGNHVYWPCHYWVHSNHGRWCSDFLAWY